MARQQAGVDVEDAAVEGGQGPRPHPLHVARQTDHLGPLPAQCLADRRVEGGGVRMGAAAQVAGGDPLGPRPGEGLRPRVVGDDDAGLGLQPPVAAGVEDGLQVGAAAGGQEPEAQGRPAHGGQSPAVPRDAKGVHPRPGM